jgi:hypothetical protein
VSTTSGAYGPAIDDVTVTPRPRDLDPEAPRKDG